MGNGTCIWTKNLTSCSFVLMDLSLLLFKGDGDISVLQIPFHTSDPEENDREPSSDL